MPDVSHNTKTLMPITFKWSDWGSYVELAGSFDSPYTPWQPIQMKRVENSSHFEVTLDLQPNKTYDYKFVVDGNWVLDPGRPKFPDSTGYNENHQIYVEAPKIALPPPSPIEEFNLKDDEHENQHDVKPEQQSIVDEVEKTIEEIEEQKIVNIVDEQEITYEQEIEEQKIVNIVNEQEITYEQEIEENIANEQETEEQNIVSEQETKEQKIVNEQETEEQKIVDEQETEEQNIVSEQETEKQNIFNEQETEEQNIVDEQETEEKNIVNEQETEVNIVNEQETEEQKIVNEQETEEKNIIVNEQETEEKNIINEQETEEQKIVYEQEIEEQNIANEQETEEQNIVSEQETEEQKIVDEQETEEQNIVSEQETEEQNIVSEQETEELNIVNEQETEELNIVSEQETEEQNIVSEQETEVNIVSEQETEEKNIVNEQETEVSIVNEQETEEKNIIVNEQETEEKNIINEQETEEKNIVNEQETEEKNIINEQETEEQKIVDEQEIEEQNIVYEQETEKNIINEQETEVNIVDEQETEEQNIVNEQETEEQKIVYEQEIENGSSNEISITAIKEVTAEKIDEINNITIEKEEIPIETKESVEKQEIIEGSPIEKVYVERKELKEDKEIIEKHQELSEEYVSNVFEETTLKADVSISLQTKTLENAIEEKSVDSGVESVVKTVVESVVESSDIPHTDKITNSLQPSQIIEEEKTIVISEEIDTSKIIINETSSEIQVEGISETPLELNLPNEPITETEIPSTTETSSITEIPSVTEAPLVTEISDDLIDKKVNEETTLTALDSTVTISNATIIDNINTDNTDNTSHKDEIIGEKVEPHESLPEMLVSNIILEKSENSEKSEKEFVSTSDLMTEKESIVRELEENLMKETETFKERNVIDQHVISDTNGILSMSVETVQEQTLPIVLEKTLEIPSSTQQSPSILEVSEVPKESLTTAYEHKTETNEVINNHDNLDNLENNITEQKVEEFVQDNVKNELDTYDDDDDDSDTIVEENSNDVISENLSSVNIIQESICTEFNEKSNDCLEENVEKSIPVQDEEISEVKYDDWEVRIAENNTTDITRKSVDETKVNDLMSSPDESPDHEPKIEPINENAFFAETQSKDEIEKSTWSEIKGLSVSTYEETISEEKLQEIDEINEVHAHKMDNKPEPERSLNSPASYENEEQSPDCDENSHHDNPKKMDNEAFIIKDTETETNHTENLNKVDEIYTISYDNANSVSEIQNNLSITQKDSMNEDTKLHASESLGKITTENKLSDNLLDEAPGSSVTAYMATTVSDEDESDSYLIPNEMNIIEEIKPISKSTNGRKRGMTIFSPGESTKDINMIKSKHTKKNLKISSSREVVTTKKLEIQKYEDNDTKGNIFYLVASLVTTFTLGIISMLIKAVSGNNRNIRR